MARIEELAGKIAEARALRTEAAGKTADLLQDATLTVFGRKGSTQGKDYARIQSGYAFKSEWFTESGIRLIRNVNIGHGSINRGQAACIPESRRQEFKVRRRHSHLTGPPTHSHRPQGRTRFFQRRSKPSVAAGWKGQIYYRLGAARFSSSRG